MTEDKRNQPQPRTQTPAGEEVRLTAMRDDRNPIPPSHGSSLFESMFFGPLANQSTNYQRGERPNAMGIQGWLLCPVVFLLIVAMQQGAMVMGDMMNYTEVHPLLKTFSWARFAFAVFTLLYALGKNQRTRPMAIALFVLLALVQVLDIAWVRTGHPALVTVPGSFGLKVLMLLNYVVWAVYFMVSTRVRITFLPAKPGAASSR